MSNSTARGFSTSVSRGTSSSTTTGRNLSDTIGKNWGLSYAAQVRRLFKPDELMNDAFTKNNLLQLVHIRDQGPMLLFRTPYYADPDFSGQIIRYEDRKQLALSQETAIEIDMISSDHISLDRPLSEGEHDND